MAITVEARSDLLSIVVGMFNAAPGAAILSDLTIAREAGQTRLQIATNLAKSAEYLSIFPEFLTNAEFATKLVNNMLGNLVSAAGKAEAVALLTAKLNAANTSTPATKAAARADTSLYALDLLKAVPASDPVFGAARVALDNKVAVATYYSVDALQNPTSVVAAQQVLASVDNTSASVDAAIEVISGDAVQGETFSLTAGIDAGAAFTGTAGNDTFIANNSTWNVGDSLNGGAGVDTLIIANENEDLTLAGRTLTSIENLTIINVDPNTGSQDFNFANQNLQQVTVDFAYSEHQNDLYLDNMRADTDLVVTNVVADGYSIYRNYDEFYSALAGTVSQSNAFSNIDGSTNDYYVYFENYAYFNVATTLNLSESWTNVINGGDTNTGSDDSYAYSYNYVDLKADNATVNMTYNLTNVVVPDGYSYLELNVYNEATVATADVVNVVYNLDNVDGIEVDVDAAYTGVSSNNDTATINIGAGGVANSNGSNEFNLDDFETININVNGDADLGDIDAYSNVGAAQTINIVANAKLNIDNLDEADDQAVTVNISGAGDVTIGFNGDNEGLTVNAGTATGNLDLDVGTDTGYALKVTTGSGDDRVVLQRNVTTGDLINGGAGVDTLSMQSAWAVTASGLTGTASTAYQALFSNFEVLELNTALAGNIDLAKIDSIQQLVLAAGVNGDRTIAGLASGASIEVQAAAALTTNITTVNVTNAATGTADVLNLRLNAAASADYGVIAAASVETVNINSTTTAADPTTVTNTVDLSAGAHKTLNITGDAALDLSGVALTSVTSVAAAAFDAGLTINLAGNANAVTITAGAGDNDITGGSGVNTVTIIGGGDNYVNGLAGNDVISITGGGDNEVWGGDGNDTITITGNGDNLVNGGIGNDTITITGNGDNEVDGGDGNDTIVITGTGANTIIGGEGLDTMTGGAGVNTYVYADVGDSQGTTVDVITNFKGGVGGDVLDFSAITTSSALYIGAANGYGAVLTSLTGLATIAVLDSSTNILYIDIDASGTLDNNDMAIQLTGVTGLTDAANFAW